jgi:hypothetical protein
MTSGVFGRATYGESSAFVEDLSETKVSEFEVAVVADEQVLWLEIPKDDILAVEIFEA